MLWDKIGFIPFSKEKISWAHSSLLQPTPILIDKDTIRVFVGMRDEEGRGRPGFVDLDAKSPSTILRYSPKPCLELGDKGMFDEYGVVPCAIIRHEDKLFMYYAGYQLGQTVRFWAYTGIAVSEDNGETFIRISKTPPFDRTDSEPLFRVIHSILKVKDRWEIWYGAGSHFVEGTKKTLPVYNIKQMYSDSHLQFPLKGEVALDIEDDEHRVGRPYVMEKSGKYYMFFGYGSDKEPYHLGFAHSKDGQDWIREDHKMEFTSDFEAWEKDMQAYPAVIETQYGTYLFYNGNNYGHDGFGCAKLKNSLDE